MSFVSTHVLDAVSGQPAVGVSVTLAEHRGEGWQPVASGVTDGDGRIGDLGPEALDDGVYQVRFDTGMYFSTRDVATFYPEVTITFEIAGGEHCHVPLLLSPFAYSTYRGS